MKAIIVANAIDVFPDCSIPFDVHTDASDFQLGAAMIQNGRPVAHSKKLTPAQQNCTTTEKESLDMVMTLKEHRKMLVAAQIWCWKEQCFTQCTFQVTNRDINHSMEQNAPRSGILNVL